MPSVTPKSPSKPKFPPGGFRALDASSLEDEAIYRGRVLENAALTGQHLTSVSFEGCVFRHMDLRQMDWQRVRCVDVRFEQCDLTGTVLREVSFERVEFLEGCVALTWPPADEGQGWPEVQATPAATVNHVWNARF